MQWLESGRFSPTFWPSHSRIWCIRNHGLHIIISDGCKTVWWGRWITLDNFTHGLISPDDGHTIDVVSTSIGHTERIVRSFRYGDRVDRWRDSDFGCVRETDVCAGCLFWKMWIQIRTKRFCFLTQETVFSWRILSLFAYSVCNEKVKIEILVSEYSEWSKTSRNMIFSWRPDVCVYGLDFVIFKPL